MDMVQILMVAEIIISSILVVVIVIQPSSSDTGTLFGGGFGDEVKRTKRGFELFLYNATIFLAALWVALAIAIMILNK